MIIVPSRYNTIEDDNTQIGFPHKRWHIASKKIAGIENLVTSADRKCFQLILQGGQREGSFQTGIQAIIVKMQRVY